MRVVIIGQQAFGQAVLEAFHNGGHEVAGVFHRHGIGVRVLGAAHGVVPDALRIMAPRHDERARFAAALADVIDERVAARRRHVPAVAATQS